MANNDKLAFDSNWEIDQLFTSGSGSVTIGAGSGWPGFFSGVATRANVDITHTKGRIVMCHLRYRVQGQSTWFIEATPIMTPGPYLTFMDGVQGTWQADATKVRLIFINSNNVAKTVDYRYELVEDDLTAYTILPTL